VTIVLGVVGTFVGGWMFCYLGSPGVTGFNLMSLVVATIGAVIVLFIYGLIARRGSRVIRATLKFQSDVVDRVLPPKHSQAR